MRLILQIASILALSTSACDTGPVVLLGHLPTKVLDASVAGHGDQQENLECFEVDPVCGANGMTYMNACRAFEAGTTIASRGACPQ